LSELVVVGVIRLELREIRRREVSLEALGCREIRVDEGLQKAGLHADIGLIALVHHG